MRTSAVAHHRSSIEEQGRAGGIRLVDGWRTRLDGLTGKEAAAIFAIGVPEVLAELGLGSALTGARAKLTATLPAGLREYAARISDRFHLDAPGWFHRPEEVSQLATVAAAVADTRRLDIRGRFPEGTKPVATLNGTLCASTRTIVAILETHQNADGSVTLPKALVPYMGGVEVLKAVHG